MSQATVLHEYVARGASLDLMHAREGEVLLAGPAGTGKSRACLEKLHAVLSMAPNVRALIVRKTQVSLASTALKTYRSQVADRDLASGRVFFHGGGPQDPPQYRYSNGSSITIGGMDRPTRIMSSEYDLIYVQEATELTIDDWEALITRLRNWQISYQQIIADCNPDTPTHWLKVRCDEGKTRMLFSKHEDNPRLFNSDGTKTEQGATYIGKLDALTGVRKLRLRDGKWVAAEGQVYEDYDESTHVIKWFKPPRDWRRTWTIDFGFTNPFVWQAWATDPDGRMFLYREIYRTRRLVADHAKDILAVVKDDDGNWDDTPPSVILCDHDAEGREQLRKELGRVTTAATKTVSTGIQAVQQRLRIQEDGRPRLYLMRGALVHADQDLVDARKPTCTIDEIAGYVWEDTRTGLKETPLKEDDHGMDAMRYAVAHYDLRGGAGVRFL